MILTEQMYKNLYRPYYHGQRYKDRDKTKALFSCYYLSTDPYYAYQYAGHDGHIKVHYLKKGLDICNLKSKTDKRRVEAFCRKVGITDVLALLDKLSKEDWLDCFQSAEVRDSFVDALQSLGYDGFFNNEASDEINGVLPKSKGRLGFPSIGIFDESSILTEKTLKGYNEFLDLKRMQKALENEKEYFKRILYDIYNDYGELNPSKVNEALRMLEKATCLIQQKDALEVLNNFDPKDAELFLSENTRIFKEHVKDWWERNPTDTELSKLPKGKFFSKGV